MTQILKPLSLVLFVTSLATGCQTMSQPDATGRTEQLVFANPDSAWLPQGTYPSLDALRGVAPGMSKAQLYEMFGRPHFREGFVNVREWDYLFHFKTATGVVDCQYKVVFDSQMALSHTHWREPSCANLLKPAEPEVRIVERVIEKPVSATPSERVKLAADALFDYNKSHLEDLLPGGVERLDALVDKLRRSGDIERVSIVGHTDELGGTAYNAQLSTARAVTVRDYLAARGIAVEQMSATGVGEAVPLVRCTERTLARQVACLAPNRRVEVETWARLD